MGVGRWDSSNSNPSEVSYVQLGGLGGAVNYPSWGCFGAEAIYKNCLAF